MTEKLRNFHLPCPLSAKVDWREKEMMNSSGLKCEVCVVHFKWIKGERGVFCKAQFTHSAQRIKPPQSLP